MAQKVIDLTNKKIDKLFVIDRSLVDEQDFYNTHHKRKTFWRCNCDCGKKNVIKSGNYLRSKNLKHEKSCGCVANITKHLTKNNKFNNYNLQGEFGIGYMNNGENFLFDLEDYDKIKNYCWHLDGNGYVVANSKDTTNSTLRLSRVIMNVTNPSILVDHKSWNLLDNRKSNLRIANSTENNINIHRKSNNTSGYTGITRQKSGHWLSRISKNGIRYNLGTYPTFKEAVIARHKAEKYYIKNGQEKLTEKIFRKYLQRRL